MFRAAQPARLLARLESVAALIEISRPADAVMLDALRLAASSCMAQSRNHASDWHSRGGSTVPLLFPRLPRDSLTAGPRGRSFASAADEAAAVAAADHGDAADYDNVMDNDSAAHDGEGNTEELADEDIDEVWNANVWELRAGELEEELEQEGDQSGSQKEEAEMRARWDQAMENYVRVATERESDDPIPNLAGQGRAGWQLLGVDEENCQPLFAIDFTGGRVPNNEQNTLLSDEAKQFMAHLHALDPERCTPAFLAWLFRIRQQRVMAILALKDIYALPIAQCLEAEAQLEREQEEEAEEAAEAAAEEAAEEAEAAAEAQAAEADGAAAAAGPSNGDNSADAAAAPVEDLELATADEALAAAQPEAGEGAASASPDSPAAADGAQSADGTGAADGNTAASDGGEAEEGEEEEGYRMATLMMLKSSKGVDEFTKDMHELDVLAEVQDIIEHDVWECIYAEGTDERHIKLLPSVPSFKEGEDGRLVHDGLTNEQLEEKSMLDAATEERDMVAEFERRLKFNLGQLGDGLQRGSIKKNAPRRPKEGWTLVVEPLSKRQDKQDAFAARPSGGRRKLTASEKELLHRGKALPRRRFL